MSLWRLSPPARADLVDAWQFIARDNALAADRLIDLLTEKFILLARQPGLGRSCPEIHEDLRRFSVPPYVIFYRTSPDGLDIVRVLHGSRDIDALLGE